MIRTLFYFWGAEDEGDEGEETPEVSPTAVPTTKEMTAEEIEKMTARAADRAARKARKNLADELGFENLDAMKGFVSERQAADKDAMDEQARAVADAAEAKKEYQTLQANLVSDRLDIAVQRQVLASGITEDKKVSRVAALIRLALEPDVISEEDTWEEVITDALSSVQEDVPELFGSQGSGFGSGDGGARGASDKPEDLEAARRERLEKQFASKGLIQYDPNAPL